MPSRRQFWAVALASLLWNAFDCLDYLLTQIRYPGYIESFPPDLISWIDTFPYWATAAWGLGAGFSLVGSILLLVRSRRAIPVFLASLLFAVLSVGYRHFSGAMPASLDRLGGWLADLILLAAIAVQVWYARRVLR